MANTTPEPWVPEGADASGTPVTADQEGERGTSVDDSLTATDSRGPALGKTYQRAQDRTPVATSGVPVNVRESAGTPEG